MLRRPHRQGENGHRRILPARTDKAASVYNVKVLDVVALTPFVENTRLGVVAHAAGTQFMNAVSRGIRFVVLGKNFETRTVSHLHTCIYRIARHVEFVICIASIDVESRNVPGIDDFLVYADAMLIMWQHLAHDANIEAAAAITV